MEPQKNGRDYSFRHPRFWGQFIILIRLTKFSRANRGGRGKLNYAGAGLKECITSFLSSCYFLTYGQHTLPLKAQLYMYSTRPFADNFRGRRGDRCICTTSSSRSAGSSPDRVFGSADSCTLILSGRQVGPASPENVGSTDSAYNRELPSIRASNSLLLRMVSLFLSGWECRRKEFRAC